jgi:hypothetical protein
MKKIIIVGSGGHAAEIVEYIEFINYSKESEKVTYQINSLTNTTASLILVEYLNDSGNIAFSSGSVNLVKQ